MRGGKWCMRCGKPIMDGGWCLPCHRRVCREIEARQRLPVGCGKGLGIDQVSTRTLAGFTQEETELIQRVREVLQKLKRSLHVRGCGYYALDDMHPWQEVAYRAWEESET